ncbi:MAG: hypothetical protein ABI840_08630 [bacterium]
MKNLGLKIKLNETNIAALFNSAEIIFSSGTYLSGWNPGGCNQKRMMLLK